MLAIVLLFENENKHSVSDSVVIAQKIGNRFTVF